MDDKARIESLEQELDELSSLLVMRDKNMVQQRQHWQGEVARAKKPNVSLQRQVAGLKSAIKSLRERYNADATDRLLKEARQAVDTSRRYSEMAQQIIFDAKALRPDDENLQRVLDGGH